MNNGESKQRFYSFFIVIIVIIVAYGRIQIDSKSETDIVIIMSVVNIVAMGFVLFFFINDLRKSCTARIKQSGIDTKTKKRMYIMLSALVIIFLFFYSYFSILYLRKFKNAAYNDVLSIIALSVSIANNGLIEDLIKPLFNLLKNTDKHYNKLYISIKNKWLLAISCG